jgi:hypothetical protein
LRFCHSPPHGGAREEETTKQGRPSPPIKIRSGDPFTPRPG